LSELDDLFGCNPDVKIDIEQAIGRLTFREATVLYLWAVCEKSQIEVADFLGLHERTIRRILTNISNKCPD
jgi:DNA-binding CsgD family transcriptional regulator